MPKTTKASKKHKNGDTEWRPSHALKKHVDREIETQKAHIIPWAYARKIKRFFRLFIRKMVVDTNVKPLITQKEYEWLYQTVYTMSTQKPPDNFSHELFKMMRKLRDTHLRRRRHLRQRRRHAHKHTIDAEAPQAQWGAFRYASPGQGDAHEYMPRGASCAASLFTRINYGHR